MPGSGGKKWIPVLIPPSMPSLSFQGHIRDPRWVPFGFLFTHRRRRADERFRYTSNLHERDGRDLHPLPRFDLLLTG